jgi:hypothetical protein
MVVLLQFVLSLIPVKLMNGSLPTKKTLTRLTMRSALNKQKKA